MGADTTHAGSASADRGGPLAGLVVLDLSRVLSGPYAAMILGDLGARVVKVERPEVGDDTRAWGPPFAGVGSARESTYYLSVNRNKESVTLDLKDPGDRLALIELVRIADILIENFRPGVLDRLGLSDQTLQELNPRLVILSITGFGHDGPESTRAGYDQVLQGESGLMSLTGPDSGQPTKVGVPISDLLAGMFGVAGILAALYERRGSGRGDVVRTSLLASSVAVQTFQATRWLIAGEVPEPEGNQHPTVAPYGAFACRGEHLQVAVGNESIWRRFASLLRIDPEEERFATNSARVANRTALTLVIEAQLAKRSTGDWVALFGEHGIPAGQVKTLDQVYADPQVLSQGLVLDVAHPTLGTLRLPGPPLRFDRAKPVTHLPPPTLGEHDDDLRHWLTHPSRSQARRSCGD